MIQGPNIRSIDNYQPNQYWHNNFLLPRNYDLCITVATNHSSCAAVKVYYSRVLARFFQLIFLSFCANGWQRWYYLANHLFWWCKGLRGHATLPLKTGGTINKAKHWITDLNFSIVDEDIVFFIWNQ